MIFAFYFLAAPLVWLSAKSFMGGISYLRFFREELSKSRPEFMPFVSVVVPCRGLDEGLEKNLTALLKQEFPDYEVIFVVDDENDPAVETITQLSGANLAVGAVKLVVAPRSVESGQKVENLREAVLHVRHESEVFVFADSDIRPSKDWLRGLVAPLADKRIGAATGYRWFISSTPAFASEMRAVWNASIASALGPKTSSNFCWGGSMAIRRDVFNQVNLRERWRGTVSDDLAVTRAMNDAGLPIVFVPQAVVASVEDCSLSELLEFTTRQIKITRVYGTRYWVMAFVGSGVFNIVVASAMLIIVLSRTNDLPVWISIITLALVAIFSVGKSWLRLRAVRLVLDEHAKALARARWTHNTLWVLAPALFFYNCTAALLSRRLKWRGIKYELKSPTETVIIRD